MRNYFILIGLFLSISLTTSAQLITFDGLGYGSEQVLGNPYTLANGGEIFRFTTNSPTPHLYRTTDPYGCGNTGHNHLSSGNSAATTWTIETISGNEINLGNVRFDNLFLCYSFTYNLSIQAFKNGSTVGAPQLVNVSGMNHTWTPNANFDDIDRFVISCPDLGNLGIDNINWVAVVPPCTQPTVPTVTATANPICSGGSTTLNISGTLNDATNWHIYTGFCGVTQIGTTAGSTFVVSPTATTSYYIRGEGGCVTPGTCAAITVTVNPTQNAGFNYSTSSYCVNASDPTPTITGVSGGTFSSTAGLSINSTTGTIDVSASTPATYTVTYTTPGPCPGSSNVSVTINALPNAGFNYSASSFCVNAADPSPTVTGAPGGNYTSSPAGLSINASTGVIDVSASTPGTYTVTRTLTSPCTNSANVSVTINPLDNASFSYSASAYCVNALDPTPTITGVPGGTFSSTPGLSINASTGTIDVSASTPGTNTVTYTTAGTCPNASNVSVTINSLDNASFNYSAASYCTSDADPTPTITGLAGGSFSSAPAGLSINASTGTIDVSASTTGTYTVTYTTAGACPNSSNVSVTINTADNASFSYSASSYCVNATDPSPTITGLPGGTFSSTAGLSINASTGQIDVSASTPGTYTVTYTTSGACPNSSNVTVTINALDNASFSYSAFAHCQNGTDPSPTITGVPGGTFSSTAGLSINSSTGVVDASASTPGTYLITYTTNGTCPNSSSVSLAINAIDNASFSYSASSYCTADVDPTPTVSGFPVGFFTSTAGLSINASTGEIDLSASTPGTYTVTYTTQGPCPNSSNVSVTINTGASVTFTALADVCFDAGIQTGLGGGSPTGGVYSGPGVTDDGNGLTYSFDPAAAGEGIHTITYTVTGGCTSSASDDVEVFPPVSGGGTVVNVYNINTATNPVVGGVCSSNTGIDNTYNCAFDGQPQEVVGSFTDMSVAGSTLENVDISFFSACSGDITLYLNGVPMATQTLTGLSCSCQSIAGDPGIPQSISVTMTPAIQAAFIPGAVNNITATSANSAAGAICYYGIDLTLTTSSGVSFTAPADLCADAGIQTGLSGGTPSGGVYSGTGVTDDGNGMTYSFDPAAAGVGVHTITYTYTNGNGCTGSATDNIEVFPAITVSFTAPTDLCVSAGVQTGLGGGTPTGGVYSGTGVTDDGNGLTYSFDPATAGIGTHTITYTIANPNGCAPPASDDVTVTNLDDATFSYSAATYCGNESDPTPTITGATGGTFTSTAGLVIDGSTGVIDLSASTPGTYTVTYTTAGSCSNSSTQSVTINALPASPTVVSPLTFCPGDDVILSATGSGTGNLIFYNDVMVQIASVPMPPATGTHNAGALANGSYTYFVTEENGGCESVPTSIDFLVGDITDPTAICQNITVFLDGTGNATISASDLDGGSSDNCGPVTLSASQTSFDCSDIGGSPAGTLIITGAYDGPLTGGTPKGVELYVANDIADLSQYGLGSANNGGGTDGQEFTFPAVSVTAGTYIYVASEAPQFTNFFGFAPDYTDVSMGINGDDAVELFHMGSVIDVFGDINLSGTGQPWEYLDGWAYRNSGTGPDGTTFAVGSWSFSGINVYDGQTTNATTPTPLPIGTFTPASSGSTLVTLTATDGVGNTGSCTANVTVLDTISPVITCPGDQTESLDATCSFTLPDYAGLATASDNCGTPTLTQSPIAGTVITADQVVTLSAEDVNGNTTTCTFNVFVSDNTPPVAVCQNITVFLDGAGNASITAADLDGGSTDNCGSVTLSASQLAFTCADIGANSVTLTVTDANLNSSSCTATVTVVDTISPVVSCPGDQTETASAACNFTLPDYTGLVSASDNCGIPTVTQSPIAGTVITSDQVITMTSTDASGNTSTCTFNVLLIGATPPTAVCQNITVFLDGTGNASITAADIDGGSTASCGGLTLSASQTTFTCADLGSVNVTLTATDGGGNTDNCTAVVTVVDNISPTPDVAVLADVTADCQVTSFVAPTASDNCSTIIGTHDATLPITTQGTTVVTWTYDDGNGNVVTQTQNVVISDAIAPVPDLATLIDVTAECEVTSLTAPTATDNCGSVTVTNDATLPISAQGTTVVTWTYDDGNGNTSTQTQNVVINDFSSPLPTAAPLPDVVGQCSVDVMPTAPVAVDACAGLITGVEMTGTTFPITTQGTTVLLWQFDDGNGNITTQTQNIIVNDVTAPTPDVATLPTINGDCSIDTPAAPTATDNCDGTIVGTTTTIFPITALGSTTIIWEFVDANGNTSSQTQIAVNSGIDASITLESDNVTMTANTAGATYAWLNCDFNTVITGETSQSFTPAANGNYACIVTVGNCTDTSACQTINSVGIDGLALAQLSVYPNPSATGLFTVKYDGNIQAIDVVDMLGRIIELPTDLTSGLVDGSELAYGRYVIRVTTETTVLTTEIVIAK